MVIAIAAIVLLGGGGGRSSGGSTYSQSLTAGLTPLISANQQLSSTLLALPSNDAHPTGAQTAAQQAQTALTSGQGAVGVLTVPTGSAPLSQQVKQALAEETGYLQVVSAILGSPTAAAATQLVPLASSTTAALVPLDSIISNASSSIGGTNNLVLWAQRQAGNAQRARIQAQNNTLQQAVHSASQSASSGGGGSSPASSSTDCGGGLIAGPDTSCPFAQSVETAYEQAPGAAATVEAYSPVTNQTYAMSCAPAGSGVTCSGGNNASVTFP